MSDLVVTLLEVGNSEAPNIGTIVHSGDENEFNDKVKRAIEAHFDNAVSIIVYLDGLRPEDVKNSSPIDALVYFKDGDTANIEIQQTWIY